MTDYGEELIHNIENKLLDTIDTNIIEKITDIITIELKDYIIEKQPTGEIDDNKTNDELIDSFMGCLSIEGKSEKTIKQYKRSLKQLFIFLDNKNYYEVTTRDIRSWLSSLKLANNKNVSIRNQKNYITPFFTWLYNEELIGRNPCAPIRPIKVPHEDKFAFTSEEVDTIRSICKNVKERAMIEFLLSSGVRVSEMCNIKLEDVDINNLVVRVKGGKGEKDRTTFITPIAKKYIINYLKENKHKSEYLFTNCFDTCYSIAGIKSVTSNLSKRSGIHIHPHRFRRTLATDLARKGMPIQEIQKLLGHTSIETTKDYIEVRTEAIHASYRQFVA